MKRVAVSFLRALDRGLARLQARRPDPPGLTVLLFHALFESEEELYSGLTDPTYGVTVGQFEAVCDHFARAGYAFLAPSEPVPTERPAVLLTFDDGYANNRLALPVLETYRAPALFFLATAYVESGRGFWWDTLYRERRRQGRSMEEIHAEERTLSPRPSDEIEAYVRETFGDTAFEPAGDLDRPLTPAEVGRMAASPFVYWGNHTHDHAALPACSDAEVRRQVDTARRLLDTWAGQQTGSLAYPNGFVDERVQRLVDAEGITTTYSTHPTKLLPGHEAAYGAIGRFAVSGPDAIRGRSSIDTQCALIRTDRSLLRAAAAVRRGRSRAGGGRRPRSR